MIYIIKVKAIDEDNTEYEFQTLEQVEETIEKLKVQTLSEITEIKVFEYKNETETLINEIIL